VLLEKLFQLRIEVLVGFVDRMKLQDFFLLFQEKFGFLFLDLDRPVSNFQFMELANFLISHSFLVISLLPLLRVFLDLKLAPVF